MVVLDYNKSYRKAVIQTDDLTFESIRLGFSVPKDSSHTVETWYSDNNSYFITNTGMFEYGMTFDVMNHLVDMGLDFSITPELDAILEHKIPVIDFFDGLVYENRYYGKDSLIEAFSRGKGIFHLATGAGKSFIQASLIENYFRVDPKLKYIILVPGVGLVEQLHKDFKEYGVSFTHSKWSGENPLDKSTNVIIINNEYFLRAYPKNKKWIDKVDIVLVDECHKIKRANKIYKNVHKIKTPMKYAFTGTLPPDQMDKWKLIGLFGPVLYVKNSFELRQEKFLADVEVKGICLNHGIIKRLGYKDELEFLYNSRTRNTLISKLVSNLQNNCLVLVNHLEHGEILKRYMEALTDKSVYFVYGDTPVEERMRIISEMEQNKNVCCIAMSSIFSTGINIKNLHYILLVALGKSFTRIVQSIGRSLRLHPDKTQSTIIDVYDSYAYSYDHFLERKRIYEDEQIHFTETEIEL